MKLSQTGSLLIVTEIFHWWASQMRSLLHASVQRGARLPDALIISIDKLDPRGQESGAPSGSVLLRRNGRESYVQALDLAVAAPVLPGPQLPAILRMPHGDVLCRDVVLPLATARDLKAAIGFEMDRLTPFAADEVYWGVSGVAADRARGKLNLRLSVVLRAQVEGLLEALARLRLAPGFIEVEAGRIDLAMAARPGRIGQTSLSLLCAVLALACLAAPVLRQQMALDAANRDIDARAPAAHIAMELRQRLAIAASGRAAIASARRAGDALQVLAALTDALPDGTWINDLTLKSGGLTIDGQSANAAQLIGRLSSAPGLHDPSFTAPVTRTADGKADQFSLYVLAGP